MHRVAGCTHGAAGCTYGGTQSLSLARLLVAALHEVHLARVRVGVRVRVRVRVGVRVRVRLRVRATDAAQTRSNSSRVSCRPGTLGCTRATKRISAR